MAKVATSDSLLRFLSEGAFVGRSNAVPLKTLASVLRCSQGAARQLVAELQCQGIAICGEQASGYFIAATAEELHQQCESLREAALAALRAEAALCGQAVPDVLQMILERGTAAMEKLAGPNIVNARRSWHGVVPDYVAQLARLCDQRPRAEVAAELELSELLIDMVLRNTYRGRLDLVEARVLASAPCAAAGAAHLEGAVFRASPAVGESGPAVAAAA